VNLTADLRLASTLRLVELYFQFSVRLDVVELKCSKGQLYLFAQCASLSAIHFIVGSEFLCPIKVGVLDRLLDRPN
jgi:hypothetical protein